ncbi:unnamed protein product [Ceutorhynchus assimilis]|uniref:Uncharacterized protein n=1 Tax=Ceutorhynchus assimilis TaxID=467358 RepID=A0A9N9N0Y6_9CUCU|nr:unnamed protein product [Ceutorhynchus assimilis]
MNKLFIVVVLVVVIAGLSVGVLARSLGGV